MDIHHKQYGAGSILSNNQTGDEIGALVNYLPNNRILLFRIQDKTYPVFSKLEISPALSKVGHINDLSEDGKHFKHTDLREQLLKYYNTRNISKNEKTILQDFLDQTFPLGIPEYKAELTKEDECQHQQSGDLQPGCRIHLNTTANSSIADLDDKVVYLMSKNPNGIWVAKPSNDDVKFKYLFYSNKDIPKFSGISRYNIIRSKNEVDENDIEIENPDWINFKKQFGDIDTNNNNTDMTINGTYVVVNPETKEVILPTDSKYEKMEYCPFQDNLIIKKGMEEDKSFLNFGKGQEKAKIIANTLSSSSSENEEDSDNEYHLEGGTLKSTKGIAEFLDMDLDEKIQVQEDISDVSSDDFIENQSLKYTSGKKKLRKKNLKNKIKKKSKESEEEDDDEDNDDFFEYDFEDDDIIIKKYDTFQIKNNKNNKNNTEDDDEDNDY